MSELLPVACRQCSMPVEEVRRDWATPVCFVCLPPPRPLPVRPVRETPATTDTKREG